MPWNRSDGSSLDQMYQSCLSLFGSAASMNHGCSSEVWFTTRSIITLMPRLPAR
jgi:hypothetical protein